MNRLLKLILILLGLAVCVVVAAVIVIPMVFDPNDYKGQITELVEKETGRKLSLTGAIGLSVFPWLGVDLGAVSLGNAPGFGPEPFVRSEHAQVRVKLLPLLRKRVEMDTLSLQGLELNLARDKAGKSNWDDLLQRRAPAKEAAPAQPADRGTKAPPVAALALGGVAIENARMTWDDQQKGERYAVQGLNLKTGAISPDEPIELDLSFGVDAGKVGVTGDIALQSVVRFDLDAQRYGIKPLDLRAKLKGKPIPGGTADVTLTAGAIEADLKQNTAAVSGLAFEALGAAIADGSKGPLTVNLDSKRVDVDIAGHALAVSEGKLKISGGDLTPLLKELGVSNPGLDNLSIGLKADAAFSGTGKKVAIAPFHVKVSLAGGSIPNNSADVTLGTRADLDLDKQTLGLSDLALQGLGLDLKGEAKAEGIQKDPTFAGTLKLTPFDARKLLTQLGQPVPETADPKVLTNVGFETALTGSKNSVSLSKLLLRLDDTQLKGDLAVADFAKPAIDFKLSVDALDADRYLPPKRAGETKGGEKPEGVEKDPAPAAPGGAAGGPGGKAGGGSVGLPVDTLRNLNVKGNFAVAKLKIAHAVLTNISLSIDAKNGNINLNPIAANLYQGTFAGTIGLDARAAPPKLSLHESLTGVQVEPLLKDLSGKARIAGATDLKSDLIGVGANADEMKRTLSGTAEFQFRDGALIGINLGQLVRKAQAGFVGKVEENARTDFSELKGSLNFDQGVVSNQDLVLKSPLLRVEGQGKADLVSERIDYVLNTRLATTAEGETSKLAGITVPIKVRGTFGDPSYAPDVAGVLKATAEKEIEKHKGKLQEKLQDKLQDLFKR